MKLLLLALSGMFLFACGHSQTSTRGEFATNPNGLMYNDADMKLLRRIVDSLDLKFKSCDLNRKFYSAKQGRATYIRFESKTHNLATIKKAMDDGQPPLVLINTFRSFMKEIDSCRLIIETGDKTDEGKPYFLEGGPANGYDSWYIDGKAPVLKPNQWNYGYYPAQEKGESNSIVGWYFQRGVYQQEIPEEYARLIQYVDCMVDTSKQIWVSGKYKSSRYDYKSDAIIPVANYIFKKRGMKQITSDSDFVFLSDSDMLYAKNDLARDKDFITLLSSSADNCINSGNSNSQLEDIVADIISKSKALQMKRSYRVIGGCSQDQAPRIQALEIARLSAETHCWDIFLRAHLDIMNDRFERMSDGSYAYGGRKTYLKELEELDLNIVDLMLGLSLRAKDLSANHYYGTVWRIGWALTESKERGRFEQQVLLMMKDQRLDEFNRGLLFLLYSVYLQSLDNVEEANRKIAQLKKDKSQFEGFLQQAIENVKEIKLKKNR